VICGSAPSPLAGEGWGEGAFRLKDLQQFTQHAFCISKDIIVPEANEPIALALKPGGADLVPLSTIRVLAAVKFSDQLGFRAIKVHDIIA
jgi:hypothetical protein